MNNQSVIYGDGATFTRRCPLCGRYVKPDDESSCTDGGNPNATCTKDGRIRMEFEGWYE